MEMLASGQVSKKARKGQTQRQAGEDRQTRRGGPRDRILDGLGKAARNGRRHSCDAIHMRWDGASWPQFERFGQLGCKVIAVAADEIVAVARPGRRQRQRLTKY